MSQKIQIIWIIFYNISCFIYALSFLMSFVPILLSYFHNLNFQNFTLSPCLSLVFMTSCLFLFIAL